MMNLNQIGAVRHQHVVKNGWDKHSWGEECALIHAEVSELFEECADAKKPIQSPKNYYDKKGKPEGIPAELADIVIKTCGLAVAWDVDLDAAVAEKLAYNETREYKHSW